jgi:hypothetical protein
MSAPTNLHRDLGRIEGKLDAVLSDMRSQLRDHEDRLKVLEDDATEHKGAVAERKRLAALAKWLWGAVIGLVGILGGALGSGHLR